MSPPKHTSYLARPEDWTTEPSPADTGDQMEQFIWDEAAPSRRSIELSDDLDEGDDGPEESWRRQLISALQDSDRANAQGMTLRQLPPILPTESVRRTPRALTPDRPARASTTAIERKPRHRVGALLLLGISATALLSVLVPDTANTPELVASVATEQPMITGSLIPLSSEDELVKPLMFNTPVLVREVLANADVSADLSPEIRTVRTVLVLLGSRPTTPEEIISEASADPSVDQPVALPTPPPINREDIVAAMPPEPAAVPIAREKAEATAPAAETKKASTKHSARGPRIATAYEREQPEQKRTTRQRAARSQQQVTAAPRRTTERAPWEANRQGLRTPPPPEEPNTVVKLLKNLFPFGSQKTADAQPKEPASASKATAPAAKKDSFWWGEQQPTR